MICESDIFHQKIRFHPYLRIVCCGPSHFTFLHLFRGSSRIVYSRHYSNFFAIFKKFLAHLQTYLKFPQNSPSNCNILKTDWKSCTRNPPAIFTKFIDFFNFYYLTKIYFRCLWNFLINISHNFKNFSTFFKSFHRIFLNFFLKFLVVLSKLF